MQTYNFWKNQSGEQINSAIDALPIAVLKPIFDEDGKQISKFMRTEVNGNVIDIPSDKYIVVQHRRAFEPIINGLTVSGVRDFSFCLWGDERRAKLSILTAEADDGAQGIRFGFMIKNSFDRSSCVSYGFKAEKKEESLRIVEKEHVLVWGLRLACMNGQVMRVPLKTCKYLTSELVVKIKNLFSQKSSIVHKGSDVEKQIQDMQFVTEGMLLLKNPIEAMIKDAKLVHLDGEGAKKLVEKYVGIRRRDWILDQFNKEGDYNLFGLFNSMTWIASHEEDMKTGSRERLLDCASMMLESELVA
jgi:hypothetical protein